MILRAVYDGGADPFEGERELVLRGLPADARVLAARATVEPVDASDGRDPFAEEIRFSGPNGTVGDWGATQVRAAGFAEIDFHTRRTLAGLTGSGLAGARLLVDLGGSFVAVDPQGGLAPAAGPFLPLADNGPVPGIAASRVRIALIPPATQAPAVTAVRVRSLPANVTLALAGRPALFFQAGELAAPRTTPDFGALLAGYLEDGAEAADGVFTLPFVLHSDALARLRVTVEIEYLRTSSLLPAGLPEVKLAYDLAVAPRAGSAALEAVLPPAAVPVAAASLGKVAGLFAETRIAWEPLIAPNVPEGTIALSSERSAAQPLALPDRPAGYEIVAVDLRLAVVDRQVKLTLDLRRDDSGKPGSDSLLATPVPFELTRAADGGAPWLSVELPRPVTLRTANDRKAWVLLQSTEGEAAWSAAAVAGGAAPLQESVDGGFSYRAAPLTAQLRLRERPAAYRLPLAARLGTGAEAVRVDLSRLSPLGKVAFDLSIPEISAGISAALDRARAAADGPQSGELLADPAFAHWGVTGDEIGAPRNLSAVGENGTVETSLGFPHLAAFAPDGRTAFSVLTGRASAAGAPQLIAWDTEIFAEAWRLDLGFGADGVRAFPRGLAVDPAGRVVYLLLQGGIAVVDLAAHRLLGPPIAAEEALVAPVALALSGDGAQLAVVQGSEGDLASPALAIYDVEQLIDLVRRGASVATTARLQSIPLPAAAGEPADVTFSADGTRLYLLTAQLDPDAGSRGTLSAYDARSLAAAPLQVPFDGVPLAIAGASDGSPDGSSLLVLHPGRLDRYDAATLAPLAPAPSLALPGQGFAALAVEPGGRRALLAGASGLVAIALAPAGMRLAAVPGGVRPGSAIAVAPLGDRAFVVIQDATGAGLPGAAAAQVLPLGTPRPLVWTAMAGRVRPLTLSGGAGRGVELGEAASAAFSTQSQPPAPPPGPSALSQVVAAAQGHTYELSFAGRAQGSARAEVLWRGVSGETLGTAALPLGAAAGPRLHRGRFTAPAQTIAAEVRFVAEDALALLRDASFREPDNALADSDLLGGATASWVQQPPAAPGFRIAAAPAGAAGAAGAQVRNAGAAPVTLRQEIAAVPGTPFELILRASLESGPPPRLDLRFLAADGTATGAPAAIEIPVHGFDAALALGTVPATASRVEAVLSIPTGAALRIEAIELRIEPRVRIPLTFLAEAPGELAVIGGAIAWDLRDPNAANPPSPTPPPGAPPLPSPMPPPGAAEADDCGCHDDETAPPAASPSPAPLPQAVPVDPTAVVGIGPRRAEILRARGITTLQALVAADPRDLARVLPSVSEKMAVDFVRQARALTS